MLIAVASLLVVALLAVIPAQASPVDVSRREFCIRYNTQDCRQFKLTSHPSDGIENFMTIGNSSNIDPRVPEYMHGIFYMMGNPLADEVLSIANGVYKEDEKAYYVRVYDEKIWSWDDNSGGRWLYEVVRTTGLTYKLTVDPVTLVGYVDPIFHLPTYLADIDFKVPESLVNFTIIPTEDPNYFIRDSAFFSKDYGNYQLIKIVNGDGSRTPYYESVYKKRINAGQLAPGQPGYRANFSISTHLGATQLIATVA